MPVIQTAYANGHTYYLLDTDGAKWWSAAEAEAVSLGGHLVTINDAAEDAFVFETFKDAAIAYAEANFLPDQQAISFWIGLNDAAAEGQFVWSSGETTTYTNWSTSQPGGAAPDEDYIGMLVNFFEPGKWHDIVGDTRVADLPFGIVELDYLQGSAERDVLRGTSRADLILGDEGRDALSGRKGADGIDGEGGADRITGGRGKDTLTGGGGNDVFVYGALTDKGDTITDFSSSARGNNDTFEFLGAAFGDLSAGALDAIRFQSSTTADAANGDIRFLFDTDDRRLYFDADGSGDTAAILIAQMQTTAVVTFEDILISTL